MRAIVTGGAGFIGSYLSEELVRRGLNVSIWDNLFRGRYENIEKLLSDADNHFVKVDMAEHGSIGRMAEMIIEEKPAWIFHYAAINGTQYFYDMPARVLEENINAVRHLMLAVKQAREACAGISVKVVYASSSEVYGEPFSLPSKETDVTYVETMHVRDSYAAAKLAGEFYVKLMSEEAEMDWIILRLFNVYGPRMVGTKYGQVIPEFIQRLRDGEYPLAVYGSGEHKRSFCYVTDNVNDTVDLALSAAKNEIFNVGNDAEVSVYNLGSSIMEKMGLEPKFRFLPEREGDHKRRRPDTTKIHGVIGEREYVSLDQGLEMMLKQDWRK